MRRTLLTAAAACSLLCVSAAAAEPSNLLVGVWRATNSTLWNLETNTLSQPHGALNGMISYTAGGHVVIFYVAEERAKPSGLLTDADRIAQYNGIAAAYTGTYRVDGDKVTIKVITNLNPAWEGADYVRHFNVEGEKLMVMTAPWVSRVTGVPTMAFVTFTRLE